MFHPLSIPLGEEKSPLQDVIEKVELWRKSLPKPPDPGVMCHFLKSITAKNQLVEHLFIPRLTIYQPLRSVSYISIQVVKFIKHIRISIIIFNWTSNALNKSKYHHITQALERQKLFLFRNSKEDTISRFRAVIAAFPLVLLLRRYNYWLSKKSCPFL